MKLKNLFITLGLTLAVGIGVGAGLKVNKEMKVAKADADDAMISVVIDLADAVGYTDFHKPEVHYYDASYSTIDKREDLHQLSGTYYTANLTYKSGTQNIDCIQFVFKQTADAEKWSNSIALNSSASNVYHYAFKNTWTGGNWDVEKDGTWWGIPRVRGNDISDTNFTPNIASKTYKVTVDLTAGVTYQVFYGKWGYGAFRQSSIDAYMDECSLNSFSVDMTGTYDIIAHNEFEDGGIFEMKMHSDPNDTYIYYVLENNTPTNDYIYSWGGSEQFGAWPGTKITEVVGVQEVTNNGVLHFQGSETPKLIYKIPVDNAYPSGDDYFKLNNNSDWESEARPINGHNAYWHTGAANGDAGYSIDWLVEAERIRNLATETSVCHISVSDATTLVNTYQSLGLGMQGTYIDCTTVYTHKRDKTEGNELVSYRAVVEELARIAGINLSPANKIAANGETTTNNTAMLVVVIISTTCLVTVGGYFLLRKKKEN